MSRKLPLNYIMRPNITFILIMQIKYFYAAGCGGKKKTAKKSVCYLHLKCKRRAACAHAGIPDTKNVYCPLSETHDEMI